MLHTNTPLWFLGRTTSENTKYLWVRESWTCAERISCCLVCQFSRRQRVLKPLQWKLTVSSALVFIKSPRTLEILALSPSFTEKRTLKPLHKPTALCQRTCAIRLSCFFSLFAFLSDKKYEAVVLPLFGVATPFHISTIKVRKSLVLRRSTDKQSQLGIVLITVCRKETKTTYRTLT